jgi:hypothetical protein
MERRSSAWPTKRGAGYDVERLRRRGRRPMGNGPTKGVRVRLDDELLTTLDARQG